MKYSAWPRAENSMLSFAGRCFVFGVRSGSSFVLVSAAAIRELGCWVDVAAWVSDAVAAPSGFSCTSVGTVAFSKAKHSAQRSTEKIV